MPRPNPYEGWGDTNDLEGASYWPSTVPTAFDDLKSADASIQPYEWPTEPPLSALEKLLSMPVSVAVRITAEQLRFPKALSMLGRAAVGYAASLGYSHEAAQVVYAATDKPVKPCTRKYN